LNPVEPYGMASSRLQNYYVRSGSTAGDTQIDLLAHQVEEQVSELMARQVPVAGDLPRPPGPGRVGLRRPVPRGSTRE